MSMAKLTFRYAFGAKIHGMLFQSQFVKNLVFQNFLFEIPGFRSKY